MAKKYVSQLTVEDVSDFLNSMGYCGVETKSIRLVNQGLEDLTYMATKKNPYIGKSEINVIFEDFKCRVSERVFLKDDVQYFKKLYVQFVYNKLTEKNPELAEEYKNEYHEILKQAMADEMIK